MREYDWEHREVEVEKVTEVKWLVYGFGRKPKEFDDWLEACAEYTRQKEDVNVAKIVRKATTVTREVEILPRWNHNYGT